MCIEDFRTNVRTVLSLLSYVFNHNLLCHDAGFWPFFFCSPRRLPNDLRSRSNANKTNNRPMLTPCNELSVPQATKTLPQPNPYQYGPGTLSKGRTNTAWCGACVCTFPQPGALPEVLMPSARVSLRQQYTYHFTRWFCCGSWRQNVCYTASQIMQKSPLNY